MRVVEGGLLGETPVRHNEVKGQRPMESDPFWRWELNYMKGKGKGWRGIELEDPRNGIFLQGHARGGYSQGSS